MQVSSNSASPNKNARWGVTSLVLISLAIACLVLFNHYPVEVAKEVSNAGVSSNQFTELAGGQKLGQDENRHGGHRGGKRKGKGHGNKTPTPVTEVGNEKPDNEHHGPVQIDQTEIGNDQPDKVGNPKRPEGPLPVHKGKPTKHVPHNPPDPVEATAAVCYKVSTASVNVRDGPCGNVVTSLSQGTVVTAVGSPQSKSPCSVGSFQWQQISGAANGWVANSLLAATSCPSPPSPPPTTTACYTPTQNGVNVRSSPCGSVVTQVNSGTVLHGVGAASSASSCSLGSYQWQQVSGAVSGYIATTYLKSVSCSTTPPVTPPTNPPASGNYKGRGVDVSQPCGNWQCIKDAGYSFAIPRIYMESGHVDPNGAASVRAAAAVGLSTDVYVYPAGFQSNNGAQMANDVIAAIRGLPVGRVWLDIEGVGKSWPSSTASNQKLFKDLADTFTHAGISVGVYTQGWQWNSIMGSSFTYGSSFPLWYAEYGQGPGSYSTSDGTCQYSGSSQNFNGFSSFGGWSHPFAKQYNGDCSKCGCGTDASIVP